MAQPLVRPPHWKARQPVLTGARNLKMARSAHAYVRGSTAKFYEWLESLAPGSLPRGPAIWICGDCHLGNLGPVADAEGNIEIRSPGPPVFVRELLPEDLKLELTRVAPAEAEMAAHYFAEVVGRAHALWRSIVDLIATHERAYLEHCRRVALAG